VVYDSFSMQSESLRISYILCSMCNGFVYIPLPLFGDESIFQLYSWNAIILGTLESWPFNGLQFLVILIPWIMLLHQFLFLPHPLIIFQVLICCKKKKNNFFLGCSCLSCPTKDYALNLFNFWLQLIKSTTRLMYPTDGSLGA